MIGHQNFRDDFTLPTFLYPGAARSGSTYLFKMLEQHPDVFTPRSKDLYFFDRNYDKGVEWYSRFFSSGATYKVRGELNMDYFLDRKVAKRIFETISDLKLIFCLREPVDRAFSHYYWEMLTFHLVSRREYKAKLAFVDFARKETVFRYGDYYENLQPYYELFSKRNILIVFFEDLRKEPEEFLKTVYWFIGADQAFKAEKVREEVNAARIARFPALAEMGYKVLSALRSVGYPAVTSTLRDSGRFNRIMFKKIEKDTTQFEAAIPQLWSLYHHNDEKLKDLIGRDLPAEWQTP